SMKSAGASRASTARVTAEPSFSLIVKGVPAPTGDSQSTASMSSSHAGQRFRSVWAANSRSRSISRRHSWMWGLGMGVFPPWVTKAASMCPATDRICQHPLAPVRDALTAAPLLEQGAPPPGIAPLLHLGAGDSVGAEVAKILTQLAPGDQHPHLLEKGKRKGPDRSLARPARLVAIAQVELVLEADGLAQRCKIDDGG